MALTEYGSTGAGDHGIELLPVIHCLIVRRCVHPRLQIAIYICTIVELDVPSYWQQSSS
jgi:hypothetical protein